MQLARSDHFTGEQATLQQGLLLDVIRTDDGGRTTERIDKLNREQHHGLL